jgi:uncharacterized protein
MSRDEVETARGTWTPPGALERRAILRGAKTIAVVGASSKPNRASHFVLSYLRSSSTDYEVWPVSPREDEILGLQVYKSLADLPGTPDIVDNRCVKIEHARFHGGLHLAGFDTGVISSRRSRG